MSMKIKAFGKKVSRDEAYQIIINDFIVSIVYSHNSDVLSFLLTHGWKPIDEWSDEDLEDYIAELAKENQPDERI